MKVIILIIFTIAKRKCQMKQSGQLNIGDNRVRAAKLNIKLIITKNKSSICKNL